MGLTEGTTEDETRPDTLEGVYTIMPTPFTKSGDLDEESVARLTRHLAEAGVDGVTVLGFLGEAHKLSEAEQDIVVTIAKQAAGDRLKVFAGASSGGVRVSARRGARFLELGADGLMIAPVSPLEEVVLSQFREIDEALVASGGRVPVVVHDYPAATGVRLTARTLSHVHDKVPSVTTVKLEDAPTAGKVAALKDLSPDLSVLGGLGGLYLVEELGRGADGVMTGVSYPELLIGLVRGFLTGTGDGRKEAVTAYRSAAAYLNFEFQPAVGLAVRKEVYRRRGAIETAVVRAPGPQLDLATERELDAHLEHLHTVRPDLVAAAA